MMAVASAARPAAVSAFLSQVTFPYQGNPLAARALILGTAQSLSVPCLLKAVQLFEDADFQKRINKALLPKINKMSFAEISFMLKFTSPGSSQILKRLEQTINRASCSEIIDLLVVISNKPATETSAQIAQLCLNRYSLTQRQYDVLLKPERAVMQALCQFGVQHHGRTIRKILSRIKFDPLFLNPSDAVEIFTYMHALSVECASQYAAMRESIWTQVASMSPPIRSAACIAAFSYKQILDPQLIIHLSAGDKPTDPVQCLKLRLGLQALALIEPLSVLTTQLENLSVDELNSIWQIVNSDSAAEKTAKHFQCSVATRKFSSNLFSTLLVVNK